RIEQVPARRDRDARRRRQCFGGRGGVAAAHGHQEEHDSVTGGHHCQASAARAGHVPHYGAWPGTSLTFGVDEKPLSQQYALSSRLIPQLPEKRLSLIPPRLVSVQLLPLAQYMSPADVSPQRVDVDGGGSARRPRKTMGG